jgi:hypothetical protein
MSTKVAHRNNVARSKTSDADQLKLGLEALNASGKVGERTLKFTTPDAKRKTLAGAIRALQAGQVVQASVQVFKRIKGPKLMGSQSVVVKWPVEDGPVALLSSVRQAVAFADKHVFAVNAGRSRR